MSATKPKCFLVEVFGEGDGPTKDAAGDGVKLIDREGEGEGDTKGEDEDEGEAEAEAERAASPPSCLAW